MTGQPDVDVLVVGAGPAGLSAALVLVRSRRSVLVVDDGRPRNASSGHLQGYLGYDGAPPGDLLARGREEIARYGARVLRGSVTALHLPRPPGLDRLTAELDEHTSVTTRRALVATGLADELPAIEGLAARWGRDVLHCPYCHGWEVRDHSLVVVATTAEEAEKAVVMTQWSRDVTLVLHGLTPESLSPDTRSRLSALDVPVLPGPAEEVLIHDDKVAGLRTGNATVPCEALVVQPLLRAHDSLLVRLGAEVRTGPYGELVVSDADGATGVPGVWAAGNVTDPQAQAVVAAAAGYRTGLAIDRDLAAEDLGRIMAPS